MPEVLVKGAHAGRIEVARGQILEIVNVEGRQVCDFFAFSAADVREALSPGHCRSVMRRTYFEIGDVLVTVLRNPMFELVEDTVGQNDFCMPACDPERYSQDFGLAGPHRSCRMNLAEAMADRDIPYPYLPDPVNFFQPTPILPDGRVGSGMSPAKAGDRIVLRALIDVIAVASSCPQDRTPLNDFKPSDLRLVARDG